MLIRSLIDIWEHSCGVQLPTNMEWILRFPSFCSAIYVIYAVVKETRPNKVRSGTYNDKTNSMYKKHRRTNKELQLGNRPGTVSRYPISILHKSIAGRYRPVRVADGPITTRCRFIKNASWVNCSGLGLIWIIVVRLHNLDALRNEYGGQ